MWHDLIEFARKIYEKTLLSKEFVLDGFPVSVCRNIRISRCKIYQGEQFRGYNVSKKEYFYGLKVNMIANAYGQSVEMVLIPGYYHDSDPYKLMHFNIPKGSRLYIDSA